MKAERRHELQQNELADWLTGAIEQIKPHAGMILGVIAAAILAVAAFAFFSGRGEAKRGPSWDAYFRAMEVEGVEQRIKDLDRVAEEHPGSPAALWAELAIGDLRLLEGTNKSFKDRLEGEEEISKAIDSFTTVEEGAAKLPASQSELLRGRALWGLAQAHEVLNEVDQAIEHYEQIAKASPETALGKASAARVKKLHSMEDWFQWYASVDPKSIKPTARDRQPPLDFSRPRTPQPYDDLPDDPDLSLPGPLDGPFGLDPSTSGGLLQEPPIGTDDEPSGETPGTETPEGETSTDPAPPDDGGEATQPSDDAGETDPPATSESAPEGETPPAGETNNEGGN